jgi:hypothetical protein
LLITTNFVPSSLSLFVRMMETISSSENSVLITATRRYISEDGILIVLHSINRLGSVTETVFPVRYELGVYIPEGVILHGQP